MSSHSGPPPAVVELVKHYLNSVSHDNFGSNSIEFDLFQDGLSDTKTWQVKCGSIRFVLKLWPEKPISIERLRWIGQVLVDSQGQGFRDCSKQLFLISLEKQSDKLSGFVELLSWQPGIPLEQKGSIEKQLEAVSCLGRFHDSLENHRDSRRGKSQSIQNRVERLQSLKVPNLSPEFASLRKSLLEQLKRIASNDYYLQPIQVDSRPEHFLFEDGKVTGMIDFGAMAIDTPAIDLARLVGELALGDNKNWETLVSKYMDQRNPDFDKTLVRLLDLSGALVGIANWQEWTDSGKVTAEQAEPRIKTLARRIESSHSQ